MVTVPTVYAPHVNDEVPVFEPVDAVNVTVSVAAEVAVPASVIVEVT
jgi:hypothetical protein